VAAREEATEHGAGGDGDRALVGAVAALHRDRPLREDLREMLAADVFVAASHSSLSMLVRAMRTPPPPPPTAATPSTHPEKVAVGRGGADGGGGGGGVGGWFADEHRGRTASALASPALSAGTVNVVGPNDFLVRLPGERVPIPDGTVRWTGDAFEPPRACGEFPGVPPPLTAPRRRNVCASLSSAGERQHAAERRLKRAAAGQPAAAGAAVG
jgi:hypothetical protein